jgi:hypothetical protein
MGFVRSENGEITKRAHLNLNATEARAIQYKFLLKREKYVERMRRKKFYRHHKFSTQSTSIRFWVDVNAMWCWREVGVSYGLGSLGRRCGRLEEVKIMVRKIRKYIKFRSIVEKVRKPYKF